MLLLETTFLKDKNNGISKTIENVINVFHEKEIHHKTISYYDFFKRKNVFLWLIYYNIILNMYVFRLRFADVFFMPANLGGMVCLIKWRAKNVIMIHDLFEISECRSKLKRYIIKMRFTKIIGNIDRIITVSNGSREKIEDMFCFFPSNKISVIYQYINKCKYNGGFFSDTANVLYQKDRYLLANGSGQERKNIIFIIQNMKKIYDDFSLRLVLIGKDFHHDNYKNIFDAINEYSCSHLVTHLGEVSDEELVALYKRAACFVFPSLDEGFGIPPLEALAIQTRIILSRIPIFEEIFFNMDCFFSFNYESFFCVLKRVLNEDQESFEKKSNILLTKYSYEEYASNLIDIIFKDS